ncbi:MAG: RNA polymerase factor sigma-54 [Chloroflexota bacterium]
MHLGQTPRLEQQQRLIITPELKQAIAVLQLPLAELEDYVAAEALENPMLELKADSEPAPQLEESAEPEWLEYFQDSSDLGYLRRPDEEARAVEDFTSRAPTLAEHLTVQLQLSSGDDRLRRVCSFLIDSLDANGYLTISTADAAATLRQPERTVSRALALLQTFDPPGVGARSLAECLRLQMRARGIDNPLVGQIVDAHLPDLGAGRLAKIASALGTDLAAVKAAADIIRSLDPKPGRSFSTGDDPRYIRPDALIERVGDKFVVIINDSVSPRLRISSYYRQLLRRGGDREAQQYLQTKLHAALWLMRNLEQRRLTLYRIVEAIARFQRSFLALGIRHLHSLTLRDVADSIGVHESTVSRAAANKYVQTPQGCYPLRFFFSSGVGEKVGESYSSASVTQIIRDLIAGEDARRPLSDEQLTRLLAERGIPIARRTVAKYREEAGIASSHRRRL